MGLTLYIMANKEELIQDLFRKEFLKIVAVISKQYGLQYIETAEDIVSETFLLAIDTWNFKGIPPNPTAWLYKVAKRRTLYHFRREKIFNEYVLPEMVTSQDKNLPDFSMQNIKDSELQMLFAVCNPAIASESQIGLALRILCGLSLDEIAEAFLTNKETIKKRLARAKEKLRSEKIQIELPSEFELNNRLDNVLHIIYLLFNEGYYSTSNSGILRKTLCLEALRLAIILTEFPKTNLPKTNALISLMCYHSSRFDARLKKNDALVLYDEQNRDLWDIEMIKRGDYFFYLSADGMDVSSYHIEARIAWLHAHEKEGNEKWEKILHSYNQLLFINYSPVVALNRTYALYKVKGPETALQEAKKLALVNNMFYFVLLGELNTTINKDDAVAYFKKAYNLARTPSERVFIQRKIDSLI